MSIRTLSSENRKPLSYALNRAKILHGAIGKEALIKKIESGELRIWADRITTFESDEAYVFPKSQLPFLSRSPKFEPTERLAYDIAYGKSEPQEDTKIIRIDGSLEIFVWLDFQRELDAFDAMVPVFSPYAGEPDIIHYNAGLNFGSDIVRRQNIWR